jgi:hypothetical protein
MDQIQVFQLSIVFSIYLQYTIGYALLLHNFAKKKSVTYIVTTRLNGGGQIDDSYNKLTDETSAHNSRCLETSIVEVGI